RLTATAGSLPAGIKPHMTPISSIMGQIMLIGMYPRPGPNGGMVTAIERTPYFAELVIDSERDEVTVCVWDPRDANKRRTVNPEWRTVAVEATPLTLTWGDQSRRVTLAPEAGEGQATRFRGSGAGLAASLGDARRPTFDHHVTLLLDGRSCPVHWSTSRQQMDLRTLADWVLRPALIKPGVATVTAMGGIRKQYQVLIDPDAM